jgi:hypothetical protein
MLNENNKQENKTHDNFKNTRQCLKRNRNRNIKMIMMVIDVERKSKRGKRCLTRIGSNLTVEFA